MSSALRTAGVLPASPLLVRAFGAIARGTLRTSFQALRVMGGERLAAQAAGPLVVYLNHPSWWDPLVCLALMQGFLPQRTHYAPMSAASLKKYWLFRRMGAFPVEQDRLRGAAQFLRGSQAVVAAGGVLWVTAQGAFTDVRVRPTALKAGLGALVHRLPRVTVVPVAFEYTFWNERVPEALVAVGEPVVVADGPALPAAEWTRVLGQRLEDAQDALRAAGMRRDPAAFTTMLQGRNRSAGLDGASHGREL